MLKKMNLPNKLTLLRIVMVPFIVAVMLIEFPLHYLIAGVLFGLASLTDMLDGRIARRDNLVTDFGKFADPLADKILVISMMICFVSSGWIGPIPVIIVLFREFAITSLRLVAASKGTVIAANKWGKLKTVLQIDALVILFIFLSILGVMELSQSDTAALTRVFHLITDGMMWIVAAITIVSGVIYVRDNRSVIADM